jgi:ATP-dependent RNA helicase DDX24/MAK5
LSFLRLFSTEHKQVLKLPARALHAKMQQRQRLKSLDAFKTTQHTVMVATDVAARGLDISMVSQT